MAKAKDNEKIFCELFRAKVSSVSLSSDQTTYSITDEKRRRLSSSVDYCFLHNNRKVLLEIDSYNMAKVVVGQYVLLNQFCNHRSPAPLFLVVHTYTNYEPERTLKYLEHVRSKVLGGKGIPFGVIHINTFKSWAGGNADDFINLFNIASIIGEGPTSA